MSDFDRQQHNYSGSREWAPADGYARTAADATVEDRVAFVRKVYALFFAATLFAVGGVVVGFAFPPLLVFSARHPWIMFFMMIGGVMAAGAVRHVRGVNLFALFGFTTFTGIVISPLLFVISRTN